MLVKMKNDEGHEIAINADAIALIEPNGDEMTIIRFSESHVITVSEPYDQVFETLQEAMA